MLFLLSPAKSLDYDTPWQGVPHSEPSFLAQSAQLIKVLRQKSPQDIAQLMDLSDKLAKLNVEPSQLYPDNAEGHVIAGAALVAGAVAGGDVAGVGTTPPMVASRMPCALPPRTR